MKLFHLTLAVRGRLVFARNEAERRRSVREIVRLGASRLLLFCLVDEHLHTVLGGLRIGYLGRDLRRLLARLQPGDESCPGHTFDSWTTAPTCAGWSTACCASP